MKRVSMILSACLLSAFLVLGIVPAVSPASEAYAATGSVTFTYNYNNSLFNSSTTLLVSVVKWRHEQEPSAQSLTRTLT
jgi:hypothetical protein